MPPEVAAKYGAKLDQAAPVADPKEIGNYVSIVLGTPTRFGNMAAQMRNFLDQTGGLWAKGAPDGKAGSVFTIAGVDGSRQPSTKELVQARFHGRHVAGIAMRLGSPSR